MYNKLGKKVRSFVSPRWANPIRYFFILALLVAVAIPAVAYAAPTPADPMYVSFDGSGTIGGVTFADDDILKFDGTTWSMHFDGSDLGMLAGVDITALAFLDDDTALFTFDEAGTVGPVTYTTNDIVRFDATGWGTVTTGTLSLFMTGSTVGLDVAADSIDALSILPDGSLLISTTGNPVVPGVSAVDEDILKFTPTNPGDYTSGTWSLYFDASDVGLDASTEDIAALDVAGNVFHLATEGLFDVTTVSGTNQDIFTCTATETGANTACTYDPTLYFDGDPTILLTVQLDAFSLDRGLVDPSLTSITRQTPATSPTNADTLVFRATFNEDVQNVDGADFAVTGTTAAVTNVATISASVYDVTVSGGNLANLNGVVGLNLSASNNIIDLDTNPLILAEPAIDETYTVDNSAPTVSSIVRANPSPTSADTVNFTVNFSEAVTGVDTGDFLITPSGVTGAAVQTVTGSGAAYTVTISTGTGSGTLRLDVPNSATINDLLGNPLGGLPFVGGESYSITETVTATFGDVPTTYWAWSFVERLANAGITSGCGNGNYCPDASVTRAEMAVFLLRGIHGTSYSPPAVGGSTGFGDVETNYWAAAWIKQLAAESITAGCGNGNYCPDAPVTRAEMAVFLLRARHGASFSPPAVGGSTGFGDVETTYWAAAWIKQLAAESITSGCGNGNYCPNASVTRAEMAVFLVRTFNLP